ncbi:MAG: shikimate kinase [Deltaproteobacteria bacterium]|nr:shikimate kinase [Deltaproteobacteria bacterium]
MGPSSPDKKFNVVLIGYRAVGKTTVGQMVAQGLGRSFVDLDEVLVAEAGESISDLVSREGWPKFRHREKEIVRRFASKSGLVLATGGGVVLDPENTELLRSSGKLIWLRAAPATLRDRLSQNAPETESRPGLTDKGTLAEIDEVLAAREPLYRDAADASLDVDTVSAAEAAERIIVLVQAWEKGEL